MSDRNRDLLHHTTPSHLVARLADGRKVKAKSHGTMSFTDSGNDSHLEIHTLPSNSGTLISMPRLLDAGHEFFITNKGTSYEFIPTQNGGVRATAIQRSNVNPDGTCSGYLEHHFEVHDGAIVKKPATGNVDSSLTRLNALVSCLKKLSTSTCPVRVVNHPTPTASSRPTAIKSPSPSPAGSIMDNRIARPGHVEALGPEANDTLIHAATSIEPCARDLSVFALEPPATKGNDDPITMGDCFDPENPPKKDKKTTPSYPANSNLESKVDALSSKVTCFSGLIAFFVVVILALIGGTLGVVVYSRGELDFMRDASTDVNPCAGAKVDIPNAACATAIADQVEQSGREITAGYTAGNVDNSATPPITTTYKEAGLCPVNVHWHLSAEHKSAGEYDENGNGPNDPWATSRRRPANSNVRQGMQCNNYYGSSSSDAYNLGDRMKMSQSVDPCIFCRRFADGSFILMALYVDDSLQIMSNETVQEYFSTELQLRFDQSPDSGGNNQKFLGMTILQSESRSVIKVNCPNLWFRLEQRPNEAHHKLPSGVMAPLPCNVMEHIYADADPINNPMMLPTEFDVRGTLGQVGYHATSDNNLSDIFTKVLTRPVHNDIRNQAMGSFESLNGWPSSVASRQPSSK